MPEPWLTARGHVRGCPCLLCVAINAVITAEAEASVALDRDADGQTITLDDGDGAQ